MKKSSDGGIDSCLDNAYLYFIYFESVFGFTFKILLRKYGQALQKA